MKIIDAFFEKQKSVHDYFNYREDWVAIPLDDAREYFWTLYEEEDGCGEVRFAETKEKLNSDVDYYVNIIYTQRFLNKWVYRAEELTMICVDTRTDGNKFLQIFDNNKEIKKHD